MLACISLRLGIFMHQLHNNSNTSASVAAALHYIKQFSYLQSNNDVGVSVDSAAKKQLVLIATCHVHWDPEYCDVKLIQTMMFMHRLQNIIKDAQASLLPPSSSSDCNQIPVILCGDLNSLPESGVIYNSVIV